MNTTSESLLLLLHDSSSVTRGEAWTTFAELYTPLIFYWARKTGMQSQDAADLVQDVMAIVLQKIGGFEYDPCQSFRGWLRMVTLNQYRQQLRKKKLKTVSASDSLFESVPSVDLAEQTWDQNYARSLLQAAMKLAQPDFAPQTWAALEVLIKSDRSVAEVSSQTGIRPTTLYSARARLMRLLKMRLKGLM